VPATLVALSVGIPAELRVGETVVNSAIVKATVHDRRWVTSTNIAGDRQADLSVHGGPEKAVYAYPSEHYADWQRELDLDALPHGAFGENLTTRGLTETDVCIGDRFRIGSAEFIVTQPRMPCIKLAMKFGRADMIKRFTTVDRSGFYMAVETEGEIGAGDTVERLSHDGRGLTVAAVYRLKIDGGTLAAYRAAADHPALSTGWRDSFRRQVQP
jgi:MOSC domain-containing protein YiiM